MKLYQHLHTASYFACLGSLLPFLYVNFARFKQPSLEKLNARLFCLFFGSACANQLLYNRGQKINEEYRRAYLGDKRDEEIWELDSQVNEGHIYRKASQYYQMHFSQQEL